MKYSAQQVPGAVLIFASGSHTTSGYKVRFQDTPIAVFPPEYQFMHVKPTGIVLQVVTPFSAHTSFPATTTVKQVVVHDKQGKHHIDVEQVPD